MLKGGASTEREPRPSRRPLCRATIRLQAGSRDRQSARRANLMGRWQHAGSEPSLMQSSISLIASKRATHNQ